LEGLLLLYGSESFLSMVHRQTLGPAYQREIGHDGR